MSSEKVYIYNWQHQPYKTWKGYSRNEAIACNARPMTNGIWEQANETDGNAFLPRPIKHWRKQLVPNTVRGGTLTKNLFDVFRPGGTNYLGDNQVENNCCNDLIGHRVVSDIYREKNNITCNSNDCSYTITEADINNGWNGFVGKKICCSSGENRVIKSASTIVSKKYYSDSRAYLKSRCKLYEQKISTSKVPGINYYDEAGNPLNPTDSPTGPQVFLTTNCSSNCSTNNRPKTIYKPNNTQFSVQGAVSSSSRISKLKLDTINKNGASFNSAFGFAATNAGRYAPEGNAPYFIKSKFQKPVHYRKDGDKTICCNE